MIANACLQSNIFQRIREKTQLKSASPGVQPKRVNIFSQLIEHLFGEKINHITFVESKPLMVCLLKQGVNEEKVPTKRQTLSTQGSEKIEAE